jgi:imidazolonepropionase-like amidohydrolase
MKTAPRFIGLFVIISLLSFGPIAAEDKPIVIVHARLIDGQGGTPLENATVVLRGKTIEYAGPASGATVPKNAQIIDATGKTVMPGLADLHVHLQGAWDGTSVDLLAINAISIPCFIRA